jgi:lipopolysaccharide export system protein LptA
MRRFFEIQQVLDRARARFPSFPAASSLLVFWLLFCLLYRPSNTVAQKLSAKPLPAKGFKIADSYDPPYETQTKSLVVGEKALLLPNGNALLSEGVTLRTFSETNTPQLVVRADNCFFNKTNHSVNSAGPIHMQTADGKFTLEGIGFYWVQSNSSLTISNDVHTAIQAELLQANATNLNRSSSDPDTGPIFISSRRFDYDGVSGRGTWQDQVEVNGTNLNLTSRLLTAVVPVKEHQVRSLLAEQDVRLKYHELIGKCQRLNYSPGTGLLSLLEQATWEADQRTGGGDELIIDHSNQVFHVNHHAWLKLPGQALGEAGFLSSSNSARGQAARLVQVVCENYEIRTNSASFRDGVRMNELVDGKQRGTMTCSNMSLTFISTNEFDTLSMDRNVVIEQTDEERKFTAGHGFYTHTNSSLLLTQDPTWAAGSRTGKGEMIRLNMQQNEMIVQGDASMRLPANQLAGQLVTPSATVATNRPASKTGTNQFAQIFSEEYTLRTNYSVFIGGVYATHPDMNWSCEKLSVTLPAGGMTNVVAEQNVVFDVMTPKGPVHGKSDKAVYTFGLSNTVANAAYPIDKLTLTGAPAFLMMGTNGTSQNPVIIWDRLRNKVDYPGSDFRIQGFLKAVDTNIFVLPNQKRKK